MAPTLVHFAFRLPEHGKFDDVFRETLAAIANAEEVGLSLSMPAGAMLFVVIRTVVALITCCISRLGPHDKACKTVNELPGPTFDIKRLQSANDDIFQCASITAKKCGSVSCRAVDFSLAFGVVRAFIYGQHRTPVPLVIGYFAGGITPPVLLSASTYCWLVRKPGR